MTDDQWTEVVIVGAGHAGVQLAANLARADRPPMVTLVGEEPLLPYERPPLTKRLLYDEHDVEPVSLRSAAYWLRSATTLRLGDPVVAVDPVGKSVRTRQGASIGYGCLVWAAGGRAAASGLPGADLAGVHSIRDFADLAALRADLAGARAAVIVGGGYLGLEAAAGLRRRGIAVSVVEVAPRLLARVTGPLMSQFLTELHQREGTCVRVGVGVERILGRAARVAGVRLSDGTELPADVVIVGVGMRPNVAALLAAGARGDATGVEIDGECRTSLSAVYAMGDCARQVNSWSSSAAPLRVESVHNASQHAAAVARAIGGLPAAEQAPPRFWSTQYGYELKTVGLVAATDEEVLRGDPSQDQFSVVYLRNGRMAAIDTINRPRDFARAQALVAGWWQPPRLGALADPDIELPRLERALLH